MNAISTRPARAAAVAKQEEQIEQNVARIEHTKRPSALALLASRLGVSEANLSSTLKATAFKGASDAEFVSLVIVANEYGLNPLTKEMYAFPQKGGGIVPLVSIDGWIRIMNGHSQFDGIEFHDLADDGGKLYGIEAVIYRKDRSRPIRVTEYLDECKRNTDPWNKSPARMLRHRALIQCARYAFGFSGIYVDDEAEIMQVGEPVMARNVTPPSRSETRHLGHDPQTGEVIENEDEIARQADAQAYAEMDGRTDGDTGLDAGPMLIDAIADIEAAELVADVNARLAEYEKHFGGDDLDELRNAAAVRVHELSGGK